MSFRRLGFPLLVGMGTCLILSLLLAGVASGSGPPPFASAVRDWATGQRVSVGQVLTTLTPDGQGGCIATSPVGVTIEDRGESSGHVSLTVDSECRVVVTAIAQGPPGDTDDVPPGGEVTPPVEIDGGE
jgi:hypothetical protein